MPLRPFFLRPWVKLVPWITFSKFYRKSSMTPHQKWFFCRIVKKLVHHYLHFPWKRGSTKDGTFNSVKNHFHPTQMFFDFDQVSKISIVHVAWVFIDLVFFFMQKKENFKPICLARQIYWWKICIILLHSPLLQVYIFGIHVHSRFEMFIEVHHRFHKP